MFSKNLRVVYLYLVCFITLMMVIGGVIATVNSVANHCFPTTHIPWVSDDVQVERAVDRVLFDREVTYEERAAIFEEAREEIRIANEERRVADMENARIRNIRNILNSIAVWVIALPIFAIHWRQAVKIGRKEEETDNVGTV